MIIIVVLWLAAIEPYPKEIVGEYYDKSSEPFIRENGVDMTDDAVLLARVVLVGDSGEPQG